MKIYNDIMAIANCDMETAKTIRNNIDNDWALDWSECTQSQFVKVVKRYAGAI
jgi:hypothetical protein